LPFSFLEQGGGSFIVYAQDKPAGFIAWKDAGDKAMFMLVPLPEYANDEDAQLYLTQVLESILPRLPSFFTVRPPADSIFVLSLEKPAQGTGQISDS